MSGPGGIGGTVREAIDDGRLGPRLWLYSNYHCNLACAYCLTESAPGVERRELSPEAMREAAAEGREVGFRGIGITGGEPFLRPDLPALAAELSRTLPTLVLTNATLFEGARIERLDPLRGCDVALQISLDAATPLANDPMRGPGNFERVVDAIPRLLERGIGVRVATTRYGQGDDELAAVARLVGELGVAPEDHVVRPTAARGRAVATGLGEPAGQDELPAEATVPVDGLFWSPFAPTVRGGRLDTDLLVSRQTRPLSAGLRSLAGLLSDVPLAEATRFR
jgi:MoaA/NifB/PqqE/SkfB family radical SAM enzyme